jgi:hypothetical protein
MKTVLGDIKVGELDFAMVPQIDRYRDVPTTPFDDPEQVVGWSKGEIGPRIDVAGFDQSHLTEALQSTRMIVETRRDHRFQERCTLEHLLESLNSRPSPSP